MHSITSIQKSEAVFSPCGKYRFWLCREWGLKAPFGVFLLANPSKADALWLDPTTMNCSNLAIQWGWRGFGIVNLNPFIDPVPANAAKHTPKSEVANINNHWIQTARNLADVFVLATGEDGLEKTQTLIKKLKTPFYVIRLNKGKGFLHPARMTEKDFAECPCPILLEKDWSMERKNVLEKKTNS
ncbi:MAG: DUF1643 domain-containing protein [bacterium]